MALLLHMGPNTDAVVQPVSTAQVQVQTAADTMYRCAGCGDLLHFNALSTSCRCIDECYASDDAEGPTPAR